MSIFIELITSETLLLPIKKKSTLLDTCHIAHLRLEFKEDRLVSSQEILFIRNVVECWARDGGTSPFPQCVFCLKTFEKRKEWCYKNKKCT